MGKRKGKGVRPCGKRTRLNDNETGLSILWAGPICEKSRIKWTTERENDLLCLYQKVNPHVLGYISRLTEQWNERFPELRTNETALSRRLYVIRHRSEPMVVEAEAMERPDIVISRS